MNKPTDKQVIFYYHRSLFNINVHPATGVDVFTFFTTPMTIIDLANIKSSIIIIHLFYHLIKLTLSSHPFRILCCLRAIEEQEMFVNTGEILVSRIILKLLYSIHIRVYNTQYLFSSLSKTSQKLLRDFPCKCKLTVNY
jgi:hypothetical protein